jgi:hypothetical protein
VNNADLKAVFVGHCPEMVEQVYKPAAEYTAEVKDFMARCLLLSSDMQACNKPLAENSNDPFWRRTSIRNIFVVYEAACFGLKRIALQQ